MSKGLLPEFQWRAAFAQLAIIFTGVLVALGAQSMWNRHQDTDREIEYKQQLRTDLAQTTVMLANQARAQDSAASNIWHMRQSLHSSGEEPPFDSLRVWVRHSLKTVAPITGTLDALMQTGDIRLIREDSLRIAIIRYAAMVQAARTSSDNRSNAYFMRSAAARAVVERYATYMPVTWQDSTFTLASLDFAKMKADPDARAAFSDLFLSLENNATGIKGLKARTDSLLAKLDHPR